MRHSYSYALIGQVFGKLTVLSRLPPNKKGGKVKWQCRCRCGNIAKPTTSDLIAGKSTKCRSCGVKKHGHTDRYGNTSPEYKSWNSLRQRCNNPKSSHYDRYGGRGIKVCERWNSFEAFLEDMGARGEGLTIDRVNNEGDYTPENCKWSTRKEQAQNTTMTEKRISALTQRDRDALGRYK